MEPRWSNQAISLLIAGIESETEMLRVAELLRYIWNFLYLIFFIPLSQQGHGGPEKKNVPTPPVNHPGEHAAVDL